MIRLLLLICSCAALSAHDRSESFVSVERQSGVIRGHWEVSVQDLELSVGLDANLDDILTREEIFSSRPKLELLMEKALRFEGQGSTRLEEIALATKSDGAYLSLSFQAPVQAQSKVVLNYGFMFPYDQEHRAYVVNKMGTSERLVVLTAQASSVEFSAEAKGGVRTMVREGVVHIWDGTDHILFLLALLLPAVLRGKEAETFRSSLLRVVKIITAFTVAHSITLGSATLGYVRLPSRVVESIIAISVVLAAANNIARFWNDRSWALAFGFGLIHGFGFASVLAGLDLTKSTLATGLIGFNIGVEIGQLAIVALFFPVAFVLRESWLYRRAALCGGSVVIILFASIWTVERAFAVAVFPVTSTLPG